MQINTANVMVTGGASGLGKATVARLHSLGAKVVIVDLDQERGKLVEQEVSPGSLFLQADILDEASISRAVQDAVSHLGSLHVLVNCAGVVHSEKVLGRKRLHGLESFARVIQVNLIGTFNALRLVATRMAENTPDEKEERGVIINTASVAAFEGQIGQAAYSASKGGVLAMTLPIARELSRYGIRIMTIAPGIFETPMMASLPKSTRESLEHQVPFPPRLGQPEEYAALVQHIVENTMLNGEIIRLDGALRMASR